MTRLSLPPPVHGNFTPQVLLFLLLPPFLIEKQTRRFERTCGRSARITFLQQLARTIACANHHGLGPTRMLQFKPHSRVTSNNFHENTLASPSFEFTPELDQACRFFPRRYSSLLTPNLEIISFSTLLSYLDHSSSVINMPFCITGAGLGFSGQMFKSLRLHLAGECC